MGSRGVVLAIFGIMSSCQNLRVQQLPSVVDLPRAIGVRKSAWGILQGLEPHPVQVLTGVLYRMFPHEFLRLAFVLLWSCNPRILRYVGGMGELRVFAYPFPFHNVETEDLQQIAWAEISCRDSFLLPLICRLGIREISPIGALSAAIPTHQVGTQPLFPLDRYYQARQITLLQLPRW